MISEFQQRRMDSIAWWNTIGNKEKNAYCMEVHPTRNYVVLTGREIQQIYEKREEIDIKSKI